jgi:hypothetical protein
MQQLSPAPEPWAFPFMIFIIGHSTYFYTKSGNLMFQNWANTSKGSKIKPISLILNLGSNETQSAQEPFPPRMQMK